MLVVGSVTCCVVIRVLPSTTWLVLRRRWPRFLRKNGSAAFVNSTRYLTYCHNVTQDFLDSKADLVKHNIDPVEHLYRGLSYNLLQDLHT